jgi:hypothetical protein
MATLRGSARLREDGGFPSGEKSIQGRDEGHLNDEGDAAFVALVRRKAQEIRYLASPIRSCYQGSDNLTLETDVTEVSTLTGSSSYGERMSRPHHSISSPSRAREMSPPGFTIYEDDLQSRVTHSSYISRPIDVDSMQEYDDDEDTFKHRHHNDDSRSRATETSFSTTGPVDVDSFLEDDPDDSFLEDDRDEFPGLGDEGRFEKIMNFSQGYYEGESLLEYSSDEESVDFETGLTVDSKDMLRHPPDSVDGEPRKAVATDASTEVEMTASSVAVSVDVIGPIHLHSCDTFSEPFGMPSENDFPFRGREFPILDERELDRQLVGYMEGFEPPVEDVQLPRARLGRKRSDATSTRSANTRVTFEI